MYSKLDFRVNGNVPKLPLGEGYRRGSDATFTIGDKKMAQKYVVCAVRDKAAEVFGQPFCVPAIGLAVRGFTDQVNRQAPDNPIYSHPQDFDLYELGTYTDTIGLLEQTTDHPRVIARGLDVKSG